MICHKDNADAKYVQIYMITIKKFKWPKPCLDYLNAH